MATYRYLATSLLTGQVYADSLPIVVNSASRVINGVGRLSGYLPLRGNARANRAFIDALTPRKTALWVLQDAFPVWGGVLWDAPHQSILSEQLPISAQTIESLLAYRLLTGQLSFADMDIFDIARGLISYATDPGIGPNAQVAGLTLMPGLAGVTTDADFGVSGSATAPAGVVPSLYNMPGADNQDILTALATFAAALGFEFTFEPTVTESGVFGWTLRLGYPVLGQPTPAQVLMFPGNVIDYARPVMGSAGANVVIATAPPNGAGATYLSQNPHGVDTADLGFGNPLQQVAVAYPGAGLSDQGQIDQYADSLIPRYTAGTMVPTVTVGGSTQPLLRELGLGDATYFVATSDLDPPDPVTGAPGLQMQARITGWDLVPPADQQTEQVVLTLGALVGSSSSGQVG